jgi:CO dehydrogenase/acetyl-CoA synthase epsilon subunit
MNDKIVTVTFEKCGGCRFWQKPDGKGFADCYGNPPTVLLLGVTQDALGRPAMQLETFVPRVAKDRAACSRYQPQADFSTIGRS